MDILWQLHHDNASAHTTLIGPAFVTNHNTKILHQSPFSPDLETIFLFEKRKESLMCHRLVSLREMDSAKLSQRESSLDTSPEDWMNLKS